MVTIRLKRPIENPCGDRALMTPGIHHVSEEFLAHWFIRGLMEAGDIIRQDVTPSAPKIQSSEIQILKPQPIVNVKVKEPETFVKIGNERIKVEEIKPKVEIEDYKMKVGRVEVNFISKDEESVEEHSLQWQEPVVEKKPPELIKPQVRKPVVEKKKRKFNF